MGYTDLHCHLLAAIDDGVKTVEDGLALARGLCALGFSTVVATPHIRSGLYDNRRRTIEPAMTALTDALAEEGQGAPTLAYSAEHFIDDTFVRLLADGEAIPYAGGKTMLVEFPHQSIPLRVEHLLFQMQVKGIRPVLAHPERYSQAWKRPELLEPALRVGALFLLDVASLAGKYGKDARRAAERLLDDGAICAACSDAHRPRDLEPVAKGIELLKKRVGAEEARQMLEVRTASILHGTIQFDVDF